MLGIPDPLWGKLVEAVLNISCRRSPDDAPQVPATAPAQSAEPAEVREKSQCTKTVKDCQAKESCNDYVTYQPEKDDLMAVVESDRPSECVQPQDVEALVGCSGYFVGYPDKYREIVGEMGKRLTAVGLLFANPECIDSALATDENACCYRDQVGIIRSVRQSASALADESELKKELAVDVVELEKAAELVNEKLEAYDSVKDGIAALQRKTARIAEQESGLAKLYESYGVEEDKKNLEAKQEELKAAQETLKTYRNSELASSAVPNLQNAIKEYNDAKGVFMAAAKAGSFRVSGRDAKLGEWEGILTKANEALGAVSSPARKVEEWGGGEAKKGQIEEWGDEKPKQKQIDEF